MQSKTFNSLNIKISVFPSKDLDADGNPSNHGCAGFCLSRHFYSIPLTAHS